MGARHGAACCAVAGVVYALGGFDGQTVLGAAERFDPARRGWERLPELPTRRGRCAAAACEGLVFVAGGSDDSSEVAAFEEFQPSKWQWQARPALPTPRAGLGLASTGRSLLALGGKVQGEKLSTVERFDLAQMTWELLKPLSSPRDGCSACGLLGRVYVFGGRGALEALCRQAMSFLRYGHDGKPDSRAGGRLANGDGVLELIIDHHWPFEECFDPDTGSWTALPMLLGSCFVRSRWARMPHATCGCAAAAAEH